LFFFFSFSLQNCWIAAGKGCKTFENGCTRSNSASSCRFPGPHSRDVHAYRQRFNSSFFLLLLPLISSYLFTAGVDVNIKSSQGLTAIHYASFSGKLASLILLFEKGANINATDDKNNNALHHSAVSGSLECASFLISKGVSLEVKNSDGRTPVHLAAYNNSVDVLKLFIENKAALNVKDASDLTPRDLAAKSNAEDVLHFLRTLLGDKVFFFCSSSNLLFESHPLLCILVSFWGVFRR
jgi:ankyrin repeat protein